LGDVFRDALVGAELGGGLEGDGGAGVALGGGLGAVRGHCRKSFSSCAVGRWPIASSCPSVRLKEAQPGRPVPGAKGGAGASAEDGGGRRFCIARNSAPFFMRNFSWPYSWGAEGENRRVQPLLA